MSKRLFALATSTIIATSLLAASGFAQAPASAPAQTLAPAPAQAPAATPTQAPAAASSASAATPSEKGGRPRWRAAQEALNKQGATLTVDGKSGPETRAAIEAFQKAHGLKATGRLNRETRAALGI